MCGHRSMKISFFISPTCENTASAMHLCNCIIKKWLMAFQSAHIVSCFLFSCNRLVDLHWCWFLFDVSCMWQLALEHLWTDPSSPALQKSWRRWFPVWQAWSWKGKGTNFDFKNNVLFCIFLLGSLYKIHYSQKIGKMLCIFVPHLVTS